MHRGSGGQPGFTILETMIFLVVSAAMFASAMILISGKQSKTEFTQAIRNFESKMQDVANNVSTGYYSDGTATGQTVSCTASAVGVTLGNAATDAQGKNQGCIFIGQALQFAPQGSSRQTYKIVNLVGQQWLGGRVGDAVTSYDESGVRAIAPSRTPLQAPPTPDASQTVSIGWGVTAECVLYSTSTAFPANLASDKPCAAATRPASVVSVDTLAFMTTFKGYDSMGMQASGSTHVDLVVPKASTPYDRDSLDAVRQINTFDSSNTEKNPAGGIVICLQDNAEQQYALVHMGGDASEFSTNLSVKAGRCG